MTPELRMNMEGVVVVRDERYYGGKSLPWHVVHVPPGVHTHWPTQAMSPQAVASWSVLHECLPCVCDERRVVQLRLVDKPGWVLIKCPVCNASEDFYELVEQA